jgi:hypothetical protein
LQVPAAFCTPLVMVFPLQLFKHQTGQFKVQRIAYKSRKLFSLVSDLAVPAEELASKPSVKAAF